MLPLLLSTILIAGQAPTPAAAVPVTGPPAIMGSTPRPRFLPPLPPAEKILLTFTDGTPSPPSDGLSTPSTLGISLPAIGKTPPARAVRCLQDATLTIDEPKPFEVPAPLLPIPAIKQAETATAPGAVTEPERWFMMRALQGTWYGALLDDNRMSISGWTEMAFTASTAKVSNLPVTWNDRANQFLLHQNVIRFDRAIDTTAADPTWGFRVDTLVGSDYRFTVARGLFDSQLANSTGAQNLSGVDLVTFYTNVYLPSLFQGTEIAIGRFLTPISSESEETILTPLLTRSMSFNYGGPFTHTGLSVTSKLTSQFTARAILALGNDVFIDRSAELRFIGSLVWTSLDARDTLTFNPCVGRGKFNAGAPFAPATFGTSQEPIGRNNINSFDLIWTHVFTSRFTYQLELETGYQYGVPTTAAVRATMGGEGAIVSDDRLSGTAHWASVVNYFFYKWTTKLMTITRLEAFDDFNGQRTGFKGLYTEATTGFQYNITKDVIIRPELRYDYNGYSRPFEGKHDIFTTAFDLIVRW